MIGGWDYVYISILTPFSILDTIYIHLYILKVDGIMGLSAAVDTLPFQLHAKGLAKR
jgi:hypothetical protein